MKWILFTIGILFVSAICFLIGHFGGVLAGPISGVVTMPLCCAVGYGYGWFAVRFIL